MFKSQWAAKIRSRAARHFRRKDDLPGMLLFSATLIALLLLMGWARPGHAAEMGAGQDSRVRVERTDAHTIANAPAQASSPSDSAQDLSVGNYLFSATVYRVTLPESGNAEILWHRDHMEPRLARRLRGMIWEQDNGSDSAKPPSATLADYLGRFGSVEVAFSQSQPFLPDHAVDFFGGKEEPFLALSMNAATGDRSAVRQQTLSSGVRMRIHTKLHNETRLDLSYDISIDEAFPVETSLKAAVTSDSGERRRAPAPRARPDVNVPADKVETSDDAAAPDDAGAETAPSPDFRPREQRYNLVGRLRTNMEGALAINVGELVVLKHQRATAEGRPVVFVVALEVAK